MVEYREVGSCETKEKPFPVKPKTNLIKVSPSEKIEPVHMTKEVTGNHPSDENDQLVFYEYKEDNSFSGMTWFIVGVSLLVFILIVVSIFFFFPFSENVSADEFKAGKYVSVEEGAKVGFEFLEEDHEVIMESVNESSVGVVIQSKVIRDVLNVGDMKSFDLDDDSVDDLSLKLERIDEGTPVLFIKAYDIDDFCHEV